MKELDRLFSPSLAEIKRMPESVLTLKIFPPNNPGWWRWWSRDSFEGKEKDWRAYCIGKQGEVYEYRLDSLCTTRGCFLLNEEVYCAYFNKEYDPDDHVDLIRKEGWSASFAYATDVLGKKLMLAIDESFSSRNTRYGYKCTYETSNVREQFRRYENRIDPHSLALMLPVTVKECRVFLDGVALS
jgi:hypothetical protein